ncbi:MAG: VCBS repeat-containing protein [Planctomycetes bacterium]|nr:VCBS repeat-containing protein [Planctomycetota bacterium]
MQFRTGVVSVITIAAALMAESAHAQFNNQWVSFSNQTASRMNIAPTQVSSNNDEVDFGIGDLDKNGYPDVVAVRKQPNTSPGKRTNILLMNYNGVLTNKTAEFASATDVPGDNGFLTPTNDRDVVVVDVDGDGWLDFVTTIVISFGDPKHINHPRVYRNLGNDVNGNWLGMKFENGRIPQLFVGATPTGANACGIAAGDLTGDGWPDLYLVDYDNGEPANQDLGDRLLVNDGNGFFTDETSSRMTPQQTSSAFGTAGHIVDLNLDGANDIVRSQNGSTTVIYNNPNNVGHFNLMQTPPSGAAYHVGVGDLNNDGRIDLAMGDDGSDNYTYNTGVDALGRVIWGPSKQYQFLAGGDDGFGNQMILEDFNGDGWRDVIQTDVDVDIGGCSRRTHVYHNPGGAVGAQITLKEERESASNAGWLGAVGLKSNDLTGGYNVMALDIDVDGDLDFILGRCNGTFVWVNDGGDICQQSVGFQGPGDATLTCCGTGLGTGQTSTLSLSRVQPNSVAVLFASLSSSPIALPQTGGTLAAFPIALTLSLPTSATGTLDLPVPGGFGAFSLYTQFVTPNGAGYEMSDCVRLDFQP